MDFENIVLSGLLLDKDFLGKVHPFLEEGYFKTEPEKIYYKTVSEYVEKYKEAPTVETVDILHDELRASTQVINGLKEISENVRRVSQLEKKPSTTWLINKTEEWCKERAIHNALLESITIKEDKDSLGNIPEILKKALAVSFDSSVGHDYIEDYKNRIDFYTKKETKIPFDIEMLNSITGGGITKKTLNVLLAGTGVGKSLTMCHMATSFLRDGKNVLYITLEMAEERIAERIDANTLNISINDFSLLNKEKYVNLFEKTKKRLLGKLYIKEYPTSTASVSHFRHLLNELDLKKGFKPDIIFIDYINLCTSSRLKSNASGDTYTYVKSIAEEIRGLAVEKNVPIISASQLNREGNLNSDPELNHISESFGLNNTCDLVLAIVATDELQQLGQYMFKQLKNRYKDSFKNKNFFVGVDKEHMRLFDVVNNDETAVMQYYGNNNKSEELKEKFKGFKI